MNILDMASDLVASGLVARVFLVGSAALLLATVMMSALRHPRGGRALGRALAVLGLALLVPTALVGTMARVAGPAPLVYPCVAEGELPPNPPRPEGDCVLAVEWQLPGGQPDCGLLITRQPIELAPGTVGHWWHHSPAAADQHIAEFQTKHPECALEDRR
jgi:hypothetical protein